MERVDVLVVGAGAAGVGMGVALQKLQLNFGIVDRHQVGASFARWPKETRFITPSFTSNAFNLPDLNAITPDTSPAFTIGKEHLSGPDYVRYLNAVADHYGLPIAETTTVQKIEKLEAGFVVQTNSGSIQANFLIWAGGEFQFPRYTIPGAEEGVHYGKVRSWADLEGDQHLIIGGYESGMDAACNLALLGKQALVLDPQGPWESDTGEPSLDLSPFTHERLEAAMSTNRIKLARLKVSKIETSNGNYQIHHSEGVIKTQAPPIICTGFRGGLDKFPGLFEYQKKRPKLTEQDESTLTPNVFLSGPQVMHQGAAFCFIYKFRGRFPVVAQTIAERLEIDTAPLETYRNGMWADDLDSCCLSECVC